MPTLKRFLYYFTSFCFLFTGTVVPALLSMKVFANDIGTTEPLVYNNGFIDSDTPTELTNAVDSVTIVRSVNKNEMLFEWRSEGNTTQLLLDKLSACSFFHGA